MQGQGVQISDTINIVKKAKHYVYTGICKMFSNKSLYMSIKLWLTKGHWKNKDMYISKNWQITATFKAHIELKLATDCEYDVFR